MALSSRWQSLAMCALSIGPFSLSHCTRLLLFLPHYRFCSSRFQSAFLQLSSFSISKKEPYLIRRSTISMAEKRGTVLVTVGGKGSSLSSSSVVAVARGDAQLCIDASAVDRLCSSSLSSSATCILTKCKIPFPDFLTPEESRASLFVLLNKLLSSGSSIRVDLPVLISETLNSGRHCLGLEHLDVTEEERFVVEKSSAVVDGVCAFLDHELHALSTIAVALSAISCEALKADIMAFNSVDAGDGNSAKDEIGVASDMRVLLNGSKQVGKFECAAVSEIPRIYGSFREVVRSIHSKTRTQLNSGARDGCEKIWAPVLSSMAVILQYAGDSCLARMKLNLGTLNNELRTDLVGLFGKRYPDSAVLKERVRKISEAVCCEDYFQLVHTLRDLLRIFSEILCWEAVSSFASLDGVGNMVEDGEKCGVLRIENGDNVIMKRKSDNKKKILGRGTSAILQFIKKRLSSAEINNTGGFGNVDKLVDVIFLHMNPSGQQFGIFTDKVKEILENNESRRLPKLPKGTRDFAKEKMAVREKAFAIIVEVFKRHGASSLDTPAFELRETLMGKYGEDSKLVYDLSDQGGELCSLRYDLTVPFARYVAMNGITSFKRYQIAKVYRRDNPSKGRYREFYQCDFDIAGQYEEMGPDFEVIKILTELLDELDIGNYEVKLNHRRLLDGMLEICGVPPEKFRTICSSIDKLDKLSFNQIKKEMVEEKGLTAETADKIGTFVQEKGQPDVVLSRLKQSGSKFLEHNGSIQALSDLEILFKALEKSKCIGKVIFDLSLARGLDYYTGVIYEAVFKGSTQVGSIAAGGRYDELIGMFGGKQVPAVGVSLGIERVFTIMEQNQKQKNQVVRATETEVMVAVLGDDLSLAAELVGELWEAKVKAEYMLNKRVMKHIDRARENKVPWMVIVGEREIADGVVRIKDVHNNTEDVVSRSGFVQEVRKRLLTS